MISAAPMPSLRARSRCSRGSLLVRIEMKIRLSMPSTTSMAISVTIAAQPSGVVRKAKWVAKNSVIWRLLGRNGHLGRTLAPLAPGRLPGIRPARLRGAPEGLRRP